MRQLPLLLIVIFSYKQVKTAVVQSCDSLVYCQGELLDTVQRAQIFNDSKTFVDMTQMSNSSETLEIFNNFMQEHDNNPTTEEVEEFVTENFESGGELIEWVPTDYTSNPKFLEKINNTTIRDYAQALVDLWPSLARKVSSNVSEYPDRHSLISLPHGFIIPGERFDEIYYWDSYWVIKGLIISEMTTTVRGILENFLSFVRTIGFVPNGNRVYYLNRSQPPLLIFMVGLYMDATNDKKWLKKHIGTLEREVNWWLSNRTTYIKLNGKTHRFAQYASKSGTPRPESYTEDLETCAAYEAEDKVTCYKNLKSGAESGWDFSSRWLFTENGDYGTNLTLIDMSRIIPVDLNAIICGNFKQLANFYQLLNDKKKSSKYLKLYESWKKSIETVLYNKEDGIWYDYDRKLGKQRKGFYPSNLAPLWTEAYEVSLRNHHGARVAKYLVDNGIDQFLGGTPTSLIESGQQWDYPNAWPPLQDIIITGLRKTGNSCAVKLANDLLDKSLNAYMTGYNNTGLMFEKYDAITPGEYGGGGEYTVQSGFGWSNGVALSFIETRYVDNQK